MEEGSRADSPAPYEYSIEINGGLHSEPKHETYFSFYFTVQRSWPKSVFPPGRGGPRQAH